MAHTSNSPESPAVLLSQALLHELLDGLLPAGEVYSALTLNPSHGREIDQYFPNAKTAIPHPEQLEFFSNSAYPQHPLNFPSSSFDILFAVDCFQHYCRPSEAFWEMVRLLKFGGFYVVSMAQGNEGMLPQKFWTPFRECVQVRELDHGTVRFFVFRWDQPKVKAFEPGTFLWPTVMPKAQQVVLGQRSDAIKTPYYFFYGTLMERYANYRRYLRNQAITRQIAFCPGNLYALPMGFPGLVRDDDLPPGQVAGELMTFANPYSVLRALDRLEEYFPDRPGSSMYTRQLLPVRVLVKENGKERFARRLAWVYVFPDRSRHYICQGQDVHIACGSWKAYRQPLQGEWQRDDIHLARDFYLVDPDGGRAGDERIEVQQLPCWRRCQSRRLCPWNSQTTA